MADEDKIEELTKTFDEELKKKLEEAGGEYHEKGEIAEIEEPLINIEE